ncbi:MAG: hypothetical protein ACRC14_15215 [Paracoccaceae bacterium]
MRLPLRRLTDGFGNDVTWTAMPDFDPKWRDLRDLVIGITKDIGMGRQIKRRDTACA